MNKCSVLVQSSKDGTWTEVQTFTNYKAEKITWKLFWLIPLTYTIYVPLSGAPTNAENRAEAVQYAIFYKNKNQTGVASVEVTEAIVFELTDHLFSEIIWKDGVWW